MIYLVLSCRLTFTLKQRGKGNVSLCQHFVKQNFLWKVLYKTKQSFPTCKNSFLLQKDTLTYETSAATKSTIGARQTMNLLREWQRALIFLFPEESKVCTPMSCYIDTHTHLIRYPYRAIFGLGILTPKNKSRSFFAAHFLALTAVHF